MSNLILKISTDPVDLYNAGYGFVLISFFNLVVIILIALQMETIYVIKDFLKFGMICSFFILLLGLSLQGLSLRKRHKKP